jgi:hypothetical protein
MKCYVVMKMLRVQIIGANKLLCEVMKILSMAANTAIHPRFIVSRFLTVVNLNCAISNLNSMHYHLLRFLFHEFLMLMRQP